MNQEHDKPEANTQAADDKPRRSIRSFVLRQGRMTPGQTRGIEEGWPRFGLTVAEGRLDPQALFGDKPLTFEIGFGMGQSLLTMAKAAPEQAFIGVEVHKPGVGALLASALAEGVDNLRVYNEDAIAVLEHCIPDGSLDRLMLFFPDPWHKSRHHKRRIVQPAFAELVRRKLKVGGVLHMATDWQQYAEHMLEVLSAAKGYTNQAADGAYIERPAERPLTKFEARGERLGHGVWDLKFTRSE